MTLAAETCEAGGREGNLVMSRNERIGMVPQRLMAARSVPPARPGSSLSGWRQQDVRPSLCTMGKSAYRKRYEDYMASPEWDEKRKLVFERDGGRCQECGGVAEGVHHWTYDNLGDEPLADLSAMCWPCHQGLHPEKRKQNTSKSARKKQKGRRHKKALRSARRAARKANRAARRKAEREEGRTRRKHKSGTAIMSEAVARFRAKGR